MEISGELKKICFFCSWSGIFSVMEVRGSCRKLSFIFPVRLEAFVNSVFAIFFISSPSSFRSIRAARDGLLFSGSADRAGGSILDGYMS